MRLAALALAASLPAAPPPAPGGELIVRIDNLRNTKGLVRLCLTQSPSHFPDCKGDPAARTISIPAAQAGIVRFTHMAPGAYAIAVIHDENGNSKLDTLAMMPREGFGFSRNPAIGFGPPKFTAARFVMDGKDGEQRIRMRYLL